MFRVFEGRTADETWKNIVSALCKGAPAQASRNGPTREILHAAISISNPRQRWVVTRRPALNVAFALAEIVWIMAGRNDSAILNYFNRELPKCAGEGPTYHGAYGYRLRKQLKIDQLDRAYRALRNNSESRQVVLQIWDGTLDMPTADGQPLSKDIPCNIVAMLKSRNGYLEWTQIMRSNDVFRGLPYNFVQFTTIQEIMAGWLDLKVGSYNHVSDSLHVYEREFDQIKASKPVEPLENTDLLALQKAEFDLVLAELDRRTDEITNETVAAESLLAEVLRCTLPAAYRNILCVLCAEGIRRRSKDNLVAEVMRMCTNPAYQQLYAAWLARFRREEVDSPS